MNALQPWIERDLRAAADAGELAGVHEVDDVVARVADVIGSGRFPVLVGSPGVGKTAIVHELARRAAAGSGPPALAGKRIVQISIKSRLAGLPKKDLIGREMHDLVEALLPLADQVVPFFRDLGLAYALDLEPHLELLALRFRGVVLGEGEAGVIARMLESTPDLEQRWLALEVHEPDLARAGRIVAAWSAEQAGRGLAFSDDALSTAIVLSDRFLARSHQPRKSIELLGTVGALAPRGAPIGADQVLDRFSATFKVPRFLVDPAIPFDPDEAERHFRSRVLGQAEAARAVTHLVSLVKAGLADARRPLGSFLFVGPTGVGKTHLAQLLAEYLFGSRDRMVRLNMADYPGPDDALRVFGDPSAYALRDRRGVLTARVAGHPFAVLLLDEFEKAHEKVHDRFLQLIDEGVFINGEGEAVACRSTIVIATSNAGAEVYRGQALGFGARADVAALDRELDRQILRTVRVEVLNRFDHVVHFHPLGREDIRTIALREIEALRSRSGVRDRGHVLEVDDAVLDWLAAHGYDPHFGARFLKRTIERNVTTALADVIVREPLARGAHLRLSVQAGCVRATVVERAAEPRAEVVRVPEGRGERVRSLDRKALVAEAADVVVRAAPRLAALEAARVRASELLHTMSADGFWADRGEAQRVLDDYRALDVAIEQEARLAEPILALDGLVGAARQRPAHVPALARGVERALSALRAWEERALEAGPSAAWIVLRGVDALTPPGDWLEDLARMYVAWCRHLALDAEPAAFGREGDAVTRLVLAVEGPGAEALLAMERGVHRLARAERSDLRVRVDVVPMGRGAPAAGAAAATRVAGRVATGPLGLEGRYATRIERAEADLGIELLGAERDVLAAIARDLAASDALEGDPPPVARLYAIGGVGARDPRTGAAVSRFRDVVRGKLDPLLEAWRRERASQVDPG